MGESIRIFLLSLSPDTDSGSLLIALVENLFYLIDENL